MNAAVVMMLYKPISRAVKASKVLGPTSVGKPVDKKKQSLISIATFAIGLLLIAISVLVFVFVLKGSFVLG